MDKTRTVLVEIGVEELPHEIIPDTISQFARAYSDNLSECYISFESMESFSTPRRLGLLVKGVCEVQNVFVEEKRGPGIEKAYTSEGKPTKALIGFLRANEADEKDVIIKEINGKKYVFIEKKRGGEKTINLLPVILKRSLERIIFPKTMKWEKSGFLFSRPIRWVIYMFGYEVVPFDLAGVKSSNFTFGHRIYFDKPERIKEPNLYKRELLSLKVIVDRDERKSRIQDELNRICEKNNFEVPGSASILLDYNTDLTEYPNLVLCRFEEEFLELPEEVLISEMVHHQYYFPLVEKSSGKLSNNFVVVSNIEDNRETSGGYERVLRARLNDGKFFFEEDKKRHFSTYREILKKVTFHEKLGSMDEKVNRIEKISEILCSHLGLDDKEREYSLTAASLCKNDLVTQMVGEFPELQGIMGYYYAKASGYPDEVAVGIKEHYLPRFAGDDIPKSISGMIVGIADKLDNILGIFSIGIRPRGSKDPFALRRSVFGIIRIIIDKRLTLSLRKLIDDVLPLYKQSTGMIDDIREFITTRIRSIFEEFGFKYDEIDATQMKVLDDVYESYRKLVALHSMRDNPEFNDLLIAFKRMANIIEKLEVYKVDEDLFTEKEEIALYRYFKDKKDEIERHIGSGNYEEVFKILSTFKPYVDSFFDNVLVMEEDEKLRNNRLSMLKEIIDVFSDVIDFSKIVPSSTTC